MISEFVLLSALGFGFAHAFEPDHMAAVSNFVASRPTPRESLSFGLKWAAGHGISLFLLGGALTLAKRATENAQPELFSSGILEQVVGIVLVLLGMNALRQAFLSVRQRPTSDDQGQISTLELHASKTRAPSRGACLLWSGSVLMGLLHGAAGTGAFIGQAAISLSRDFSSAMLYTLLFSVGVLLAMGFYALTLGSLIQLGARHKQGVLDGARVCVGALTVAIGVCLIRGVSLPGLFNSVLPH